MSEGMDELCKKVVGQPKKGVGQENIGFDWKDKGIGIWWQFWKSLKGHNLSKGSEFFSLQGS